jgi:HemY protein
MLGKLCLHQGLWNKAQNYLDASNGIAPSSAAYVALGHLAEKLQQPNEEPGYFQKAVAQDG